MGAFFYGKINMMTCTIVTLTEVKAYLNITDTSKDVQLQGFIDALPDALCQLLKRDICYQIKDLFFDRHDFKDSICFFTRRPELKFDDPAFVGLDIDGNQIGPVPVVYDTDTFLKVNDELVPFDDIQQWPTGKMCICGCNCYPNCTCCPDRVQLRAIVGFQTIPACIKNLSYEIITGDYNELLDSQGTTGTGNVESEKIGDYSIKYKIGDVNDITSFSSSSQICISKYRIPLI